VKLKQKPHIITTANGMVFANIEIPKPYVDELNKVLKHDDITVDVSKTKVKRSLTSNSYAWSLIGKLAPILRATDEEVYIELLIAYGTKEYVAAPVEAEEILKKSFKVVEPIRECQVNDVKMMTYKLVRGSSTYTQQEMCVFIDGLVSECKKQGVEVLPPAEVERLIKLMEG